MQTMTEQDLLRLYKARHDTQSMSLDELDALCLIVSLVDKVKSHSPEHLALMAETMCLDITGLDNVSAACRILGKRD